jgi:hypothetical protein
VALGGEMEGDDSRCRRPVFWWSKVAGASPSPASAFPGATRGPAASLGAFAAARHPAT